MYKLGDRVQLGEKWKERGLDVEIDSRALRDKISGLSERELRNGEGNLVIWLRNQIGNMTEPKLEREMDLRESNIFPNFLGTLETG